jgi:DNA-binding GntR family transcriptional regulator
MARAKSGHEPARAKLALAEHREIVDQLSKGKGEAAAKILDRHLRSSLANALQILQNDSDGASAPSTAKGR